MTTSKKLIVVGPGGHGKDAFARLLSEECGPLAVASSSRFVAMRAVYPTLGKEYDGFQAMYDDRRNRRMEWMILIREYNTPDLARLGREIFALHDIYVGPRNRMEFLAMKKERLFDISVWIDASKRVDGEDKSLSVESQDCDMTIDNNRTLGHLRVKAERFGNLLYGDPV